MHALANLAIIPGCRACVDAFASLRQDKQRLGLRLGKKRAHQNPNKFIPLYCKNIFTAKDKDFTLNDTALQ
jgi:hypothetical protein